MYSCPQLLFPSQSCRPYLSVLCRLVRKREREAHAAVQGLDANPGGVSCLASLVAGWCLGRMAVVEGRESKAMLCGSNPDLNAVF